MPGCEKCNDTGTIAIRARDGTTPNAPGAKFKTGDVVTVIPLGFSPDWAWADTLGKGIIYMTPFSSHAVIAL
jgi:hypothetical protein